MRKKGKIRELKAADASLNDQLVQEKSKMEAKDSQRTTETNQIVVKLKSEVDQLRELVSEEKSYIEELKAQSDVDRQLCSELEAHLAESKNQHMEQTT